MSERLAHRCAPHGHPHSCFPPSPREASQLEDSRLGQVGLARVINFLLRLVPGWRERHNKRVASAARIALLNVVHECDQDAMRQCLGDWDEPNVSDFAKNAIRDASDSFVDGLSM